MDDVVTNHHAGCGRFTGASGGLLAVRFLFGRSADARLVNELAHVASDDVVLDVGCGPGVAARAAARRCRQVIAVDPAEPMLRMGRMLGTKRVSYRLGTAEQLPVDDGACTVAWSLATAHHWADVGRALAELRRVLAPSGRLFVLERSVAEGATGHGSHGWTPRQADGFADRLRAAGFADVGWTERRSRRNRRVAVVQGAVPT